MKTKTINLLLLFLLLLLLAVAYGSSTGTDGTTSSSTGSVDPSGLYSDTTPLLTDTGTTTGESAVIPVDTMSLDSLSTTDSSQTTTQTLQSGQGTGYQMAHFTYDEFDRLKQTKYEDGTAISYNYDKVGNRTNRIVESPSGSIYTIAINSSGPGEAIPFGTLAVMAGSTQKVLLQPDTGASFSTLFVDGVRTVPTYSITFANITANHSIDVTFGGGSQVCSGYPAQLAGATLVSHLTLQSAYDAAQAGDTIKGNLDDHPESLRFDRDLQVTIAGGYSCDFTSLSGVLTVKGSMLVVAGGVTISSGTVVLASP